MATVGTLNVLLRLNSDAFSKGVQDATRRAQKLGEDMAGVGRTLSTRLTLPLAAVGGAALKAAIDAEEAANKFDVVMGESAESVRARFADLRDVIPMTLDEMEKLSAGVQDLLVPLGLSRAEAAHMSADMVELAADLASFNNVAAEVPLGAIQSALAGMSQPLRQFGVDVSAARLETLAYEEGLLEAGEAMTSVVRAQAVMIAVQRDSSDAMGDAARTADSAANSFRFLWRDVRELGQTIGDVLLPHVIPLIQRLNEVLRWLQDLEPATQKWVVGVGAVAAAIGPLLLVLGTLIKVIASVVAAKAAIVAAINPVTLAIGAVVLAIVGLTAAWKKWGADVTKIVKQAVTRVTQPLVAVLSPIHDLWTAWVDMSTEIIGFTLDLAGVVVEKVVEINRAVFEWLIDRLRPVFRMWREILDPLIRFVRDMSRIITDVVRSMVGVIRDVLLGGFTRMVDGVRDQIERVTGLFRGLRENLVGNSIVVDMMDMMDVQFARLEPIMVEQSQRAVQEAEDAFAAMADDTRPGSFFGTVDETLGKVQERFGDFGGDFVQQVQGVVDEVEEIWGRMQGILEAPANIQQWAQSWLKFFSTIFDYLTNVWRVVGDIIRRISDFFDRMRGGVPGDDPFGRRIDPQGSFSVAGGAGSWATADSPAPVAAGGDVTFSPNINVNINGPVTDPGAVRSAAQQGVRQALSSADVDAISQALARRATAHRRFHGLGLRSPW